MENCKISKGKDGKFLIDVSGSADVSIFGWHTERKYKLYSCEANWANLVDLARNKDKYGLTVEYDESVTELVEEIRKEYKRILEINKFKLMSQKEINKKWHDENFHLVCPKIEALPHQKLAVLLNYYIPRLGMFCEQGVGKSIIATILLTKLIQDKKVVKPLIIAPLDLLDEHNWFGTLDKYTTLKYNDIRRNGYSDDCDLSLINPEQIAINCFEKTEKAEKSYAKVNLFEAKKFDCIIFDESSYLKNHESLLSRAFLNFHKYAKYITLMSGTPNPNNLFQIFTQAKILGSLLGDSYSLFEQRYGFLRSVGPVKKYFPRPNTEIEIRQRIELGTYYVQKSEALPDLKQKEEEVIEVFLNEEHLKIYKELENEYVCSLDGLNSEGQKIEGRLVVKYQHVVRTRLIQILNGYSKVIDNEGNAHIIELPWNPKLDALDKWLENHINNTDDSCILWCRFRWQVKKIYSLYKDKYNATFIYGGMTKNEKDKNKDKWMNDKSCKVIIAHPGSVKFGNTWNKAKYSVYISITDNFEDYSQSSDRNHRYGQEKQVVEVKIIVKNSLEPLLWRAMKHRGRVDKFMKEFLKKEIKKEL